MSLHPLMDFNQSFRAYDCLDGTRCLTVKGRKSQREAAIEAVRKIGLRQLWEVDMTKFAGMEKEASMFVQRREGLRKFA